MFPWTYKKYLANCQGSLYVARTQLESYSFPFYVGNLISKKKRWHRSMETEFWREMNQINKMVLVSYTCEYSSLKFHWFAFSPVLQCKLGLRSQDCSSFRYLLKSHREVFRASPLLFTGNMFLRLCQSLVSFIHSFLHSFNLNSSPLSKLSLKYLK